MRKISILSSDNLNFCFEHLELNEINWYIEKRIWGDNLLTAISNTKDANKD